MTKKNAALYELLKCQRRYIHTQIYIYIDICIFK